MTAILSSDQIVLVTCKVCSKPVLHSSLLAHLDNFRRINLTRAKRRLLKPASNAPIPHQPTLTPIPPI
ncbi:hypothetical protein BCR33DRAFT_721625 [Rhizoclosmatium globosum]|uniref:Uncharacterized protein n=1 Tax=Rhizoclosmatium globosum TaxID=329046 RepID=A0A1Y2BRB6_9FUNG|nr:hypothetical protein BCR33DRAFT_721625 [Rhizoclosmatium globosum]|eukprot:ORY37274.1 hypothetical protein BCR33DRAFT_721625 [Rhizoclosmatium globosum]